MTSHVQLPAAGEQHRRRFHLLRLSTCAGCVGRTARGLRQTVHGLREGSKRSVSRHCACCLLGSSRGSNHTFTNNHIDAMIANALSAPALSALCLQPEPHVDAFGLRIRFCVPYLSFRPARNPTVRREANSWPLTLNKILGLRPQAQHPKP